MPSFDIVSEVDLQEARNGVDNAIREVESRFDFRGVEATIELNDANKTIKVLSESDFQVNQLLDILRAKLLKRGIEGTSLDVPEDFVHSGKTWFVEAKLKQGIESAVQKKIVKLIKDSKLKVQAQIQGEEIRVTGKSRDDLQSVMALVRGGDLGQPFQFKNFRDEDNNARLNRAFFQAFSACSTSKRFVTLLSILTYALRSSGTISTSLTPSVASRRCFNASPIVTSSGISTRRLLT